jgi:hypothetical protein
VDTAAKAFEECWAICDTTTVDGELIWGLRRVMTWQALSVSSDVSRGEHQAACRRPALGRSAIQSRTADERQAIRALPIFIGSGNVPAATIL